jgi:hypothetical protein
VNKKKRNALLKHRLKAKKLEERHKSERAPSLRGKRQ